MAGIPSLGGPPATISFRSTECFAVFVRQPGNLGSLSPAPKSTRGFAEHDREIAVIKDSDASNLRILDLVLSRCICLPR